MSSFKVWIDSPSSSNCLSQSDFSGDTQRTNGFTAGKAASAMRVNSALRQANLVVAALMDSMNVSSSLNLNSSVTDVKSAIDNYFSTNFGAKVSLNGGELKDTVTTFSQASSRANITSGEKTSISLGKISKYLNDLNSLAFKSSVGTSDIDNSAVTTAKINDGAITTAKFDSNAVAPKTSKCLHAQDSTITDGITYGSNFPELRAKFGSGVLNTKTVKFDAKYLLTDYQLDASIKSSSSTSSGYTTITFNQSVPESTRLSIGIYFNATINQNIINKLSIPHTETFFYDSCAKYYEIEFYYPIEREEYAGIITIPPIAGYTNTESFIIMIMPDYGGYGIKGLKLQSFKLTTSGAVEYFSDEFVVKNIYAKI